MVKEGRDIYADPCSMLRATVMMLSHIGFQDKADALQEALDDCMFGEAKLNITGRDTGCTTSEFGDYVMSKLG
jgi:Isocitrate/isopropylmalate dehydrogenase